MTVADRGSVAAAVAAAEATLRDSGVASPEVDARRLAELAAGEDGTAIAVSWRDSPPWPGFAARLDDLVARRATRIPLQYLEGRAAFMDFEVQVGPGVLVPRPETETTALVAIEHAPEHGRILDCGTGTGVLAISLARARPHAEIHATERAMPALVWAARNLRALAPEVVLHEAWYLGIEGDFDLVVANPPYVDEREWVTLEPEVVAHEPKSALVPAGGDGIDDIALLVDQVRPRLRPGGAFVCEIGADQGDAALALARSGRWCHVELRCDLSGRDRVLVCRSAP